VFVLSNVYNFSSIITAPYAKATIKHLLFSETVKFILQNLASDSK